MTQRGRAPLLGLLAYGFIDRTGSIVVPHFVPADPHYTSWAYIDRRGRVVASGGRN